MWAKATISYMFEDPGSKEHGFLIISTDQDGWRNLLELVVNEACKIKNPILEAKHA